MGDRETVRSVVWRDGHQIDSDIDLARLSDRLTEEDTLTWVDLCEPNHQILGQLAAELQLDPLSVEDAVEHGERSKATRYSTYTFMTVYAVAGTEQGSDGIEDLTFAKISAFVLPRGMVTVRGSEKFDMDEVVRRWNDNSDLLKSGVGALVHGLLDSVVDGHFVAVQMLDDAIEGLEDGLFDDQARSAEVQRATYAARKQLVDLRRVVLPMREVVNAVLRHRKDLHATPELDPFFEDLYDHVLRAAEWTESLRDMIATIFETNLSLQDARLNNVMKKLTSWAAIIAVPTAVTGFFGQNVPYPGFGHVWGFVLSTAMIICIAAALYLTFRKRGWL